MNNKGYSHSACHSSGQCFEVPSVLSHCWLGDRKNIRPVKTVPFILKGSLPDQVEGNRDPINEVHLENGH